MDGVAVKTMQEKMWSSMAVGWNKHDATFRRQTAVVSERLVAAIEPGHHVLDIASGVGDPAIQAAEKVGPTGRVLGGDLAEEMVMFARARARERGLANIEFRRTDGEALGVAPGSFDATTIRWGLMFMPDPLGCLKQCHAALEAGGLLALSCWCAPDANSWAAMPMRILKKYLEIPQPPPGAPGLFAFADRERLRSTIEAAGFSEIVVEAVEVTMADFDTGAEFVRFSLETAAPIAMAFSKLPEDKKPEVAAEIGDEAVRLGGGRARLVGLTWVATARR